MDETIMNDESINNVNEDCVIHNNNTDKTHEIATTNGVYITTFDNPYDPFEQFTSWFLFDVERGYNTCSHLARIAKLSDDMSDEEVDTEIERAIDEIIEYDFMNIYKKLTKNTSETH